MNESLFIHNSRIWTGVPENSCARTVLIAHGRVEALDLPVQQIPDRAGLRVVDGRGRSVIPGFIDAHAHLLLGGLALGQLDLSRVRSRDEFEAAVEERHRILPQHEWLIANGWSGENWDDRAEPNSDWLRATGDRPTICYRMDLHAAVVNEAVLRRTDLLQDIAGGRIVRDPRTGEPTGLLFEAAVWQLVNPQVPVASVEHRREAVRAAQDHMHAHGITTVGSMEYQRDIEEVFEVLRDDMALRCRITLLECSSIVIT